MSGCGGILHRLSVDRAAQSAQRAGRRLEVLRQPVCCPRRLHDEPVRATAHQAVAPRGHQGSPTDAVRPASVNALFGISTRLSPCISRRDRESIRPWVFSGSPQASRITRSRSPSSVSATLQLAVARGPQQGPPVARVGGWGPAAPAAVGGPTPPGSSAKAAAGPAANACRWQLRAVATHATRLARTPGCHRHGPAAPRPVPAPCLRRHRAHARLAPSARAPVYPAASGSGARCADLAAGHWPVDARPGRQSRANPCSSPSARPHRRERPPGSSSASVQKSGMAAGAVRQALEELEHEGVGNGAKEQHGVEQVNRGTGHGVRDVKERRDGLTVAGICRTAPGAWPYTQRGC